MDYNKPCSEKAHVRQNISTPALSGRAQLFRYFFIGGIAALADYFLYWLLVSIAEIHYMPANAISFSAAVLINYFISVNWIFGRGRFSMITEIFLVFLVSLIGLFFSIIFLKLFIDILKMHYMVSKIAANAIVFFWNFFARQKIIFI